MKDLYQDEMRTLGHLDDTAPVKKQRFIEIYSKSHAETLAPRYIRAVGPLP